MAKSRAFLPPISIREDLQTSGIIDAALNRASESKKQRDLFYASLERLTSCDIALCASATNQEFIGLHFFYFRNKRIVK